MADAPHFQLPFRFEGDSVPEIEEDTTEEVIQCIFGILSYRKGQLLYNARLGIPAQDYRQGGAQLEEIRAAIAEQEPRATTIIEDEGVLISLIDIVNIKISDIGP